MSTVHRVTLGRVVYVPNELLSRLVGYSLNTVLFSYGYVRFLFDKEYCPSKPFLTCDEPPVLVTGTARYTEAEVGWADALRTLIGQSVTATREQTGIGLRVEFPDAALHLHPAREELQGPEIALLDGFDDRQWMVWRPGEESFEDLA